MITAVEINGFKSFDQFATELHPFQVLIGANGVGKSNLFDAIVLLSHIADDNTLYEAFQRSRGEIGELFTVYPDGNRASQMTFAVEMLIDDRVTDALGMEKPVSYTRLRYELTIERRRENGFERLFVAHEALFPLISSNDTWATQVIPSRVQKDWVKRFRRGAFLSTGTENGQPVIHKHQEGHGGRKQDYPVGRLERSVLSTITSVDYPTAYAARQEMLNWRFLQFNPEALRTPSSVYSPSELLVDGSNLAAVLYRIKREDDLALKDISRDIANLVQGLFTVDVQANREREEYLLSAQTEAGGPFTSRVLSDGTLRLLALVALKYDEQHRGVLCFEEPENGVHPSRLTQVVNVLRALSTDFEADTGFPLRQILVNTHSPALLAHVPPQNLLFVHRPLRDGTRWTRMSPVTRELLPDEQQRYFTIAEVRRFLETAPLEAALSRLENVS